MNTITQDGRSSSSSPLPAFSDLPSLIATHAERRPAADAIRIGHQSIDYRTFDSAMNQIAASFQRDGLRPGDRIAICATASIPYLSVFAGALRAGLVVTPLPPSATAAQLAGMAADAEAPCVFVDQGVVALGVHWPTGTLVIRLDDATDQLTLAQWMLPIGSRPLAVTIEQDLPFNIIYSSGTTAAPKGIVQSHAMRWAQIQRAALSGYGPETVTLIATPLYSNTTLVAVIPTLAFGGCVVLMARFEAAAYLRLAQECRPTHAMLVPVQYQRLMARPDFGQFDLSSFRCKFCTSAPFHANLKADVVARWPGALIEYYGLTEGGGTCILEAHLYPAKLHTVGRPAEGSDIRLIDEDGRELERLPGGASQGSGEVVGRSALMMMSGYHNQPAKTADAEWYDAEGRRFIRTGDIGRFDEDGFLILQDRRKDMIISGGFNIYPSDIEAVLRRHPGVADASVVGVASEKWGETPVAFVVLREQTTDSTETILQWTNSQLGKTQRLAALRTLDQLPRSAIGKVLKRELREAWNQRSNNGCPSGS
jgi:long-chain acyl-CoA synthetase